MQPTASSYIMKSVLIIGGCGYIGSALYAYLRLHSIKVDTVDTEWYGNYSNKKNITKNYGALSKKFLSKYNVIILLAGFSSVQLCINNPRQAFKNDVQNFISLLHKLTDQKFIYASSSTVYGNTRQMHVTEDYDRYSPSNYYDLNKKMIDYYATLSSVEYYGLRFGTVCGYSPQLRVDLMINMMYHAAHQTKEIPIYNPEINRPILGINDLCKAILAIIKGKDKRGIYNLASFNATVAEISDQVAKAVGNAKVTLKNAKSLYNFSVSTEKFESEYDFTFSETVKTIVNSLKKNYSKAHLGVRE